MSTSKDEEAHYESMSVEAQRPAMGLAARLGGCMALCASAFLMGRVSSSPSLTMGDATELVAEDIANGTAQLWKPRMLPIFRDEPLAKNLIRRFDLYLMNGATFDAGEFKLRNVGQWLAPEFIYDSVGFPSTYGLAAWCLSGEESQYRTAFPTTGFSQMMFFGDHEHATTTTYGNAHWMGELFGVPAPQDWTYFRVTDFYKIRKTSEGEGLVHYNFMMIDFADMFRRNGRPVLPLAPLPEGFVMTAHANDGVPAPLSVVVAGRDHVAALKAAKGALYDGWVGGEGAYMKWWHNDLTFYGPGGIGMAVGANQYAEYVLQPYHDAFTNRSSDTHMIFCEGNYCASFVTLWGDHVGTYVGQIASNKRIGLRVALHWRIVEEKIQEGWAIVDFPGFFTQLGKDFFAIAAAAQGGTAEIL